MCLFAAAAQAQGEKQFPAVFTQTPPTVDGDISDAAWAAAPLIDDFHEVEPIEFDPATDDVKVRVLYNEHFLYIAADITMADVGDLTAFKLAQGTSAFTDDEFAVIVDAYNNQRSGYQFGLNPNGVRREGIFDGADQLNTDWQGIWNGQAQRKADGWTAEFAIPFKTLNFNVDNDTWGISFLFKIFKRGETVAWTSQNRQVRPGTLGSMVGVTRAQQGRGLDVRVSGVVRHDRDYVLGDEDTSADPSLDVFYKVTPSLTAALTLNTDFSATEVDDRVVNLERFSVFFPEKRAFFLQDADMFSFGGLNGERDGDPNGIPFFSRRIGIDENRQPVDINVGGKLTGRIGHLNVGVLGVQQEGLVEDVDLFVGRATVNVLEESTVGVIFTSGSPIADESNNVAGIDLNYLDRDAIGGNSLRSNAWYQRSDTGGATGDENAFGLSVSVPQTEGFYGGVDFRYIGDAFYPALGFVNRPDIRKYGVTFGHRRYPRSSYWQFWNHEVDIEHVEDLNGNVESETFELQILQVSNHTVDWFTLRAFREREVLTGPFEISDGVVIEPGDYRWNRASFEVSSGEQREIWSSTALSYGDFYDGDRLQIDGNLVWQPSMHFSANLGYDLNRVSLSGGDFVSRLWSLRTEVAFDSRWSWISIAQWDNDSDELGINTRLRWVPQPGRDLVLVVNHGFLVEDRFDPSARKWQSLRNDVVLKATYTFRF